MWAPMKPLAPIAIVLFSVGGRLSYRSVETYLLEKPWSFCVSTQPVHPETRTVKMSKYDSSHRGDQVPSSRASYSLTMHAL